MSVSEMTVRDIMIPRSQMDVVGEDDDPADFMPLVIETRHSRFPVIGENKDDVVGILLAKELLNYYANPEAFDLKDTLRPAVFVPESKRLNVLLREFRANRNHMAIVVDEYGGVSGLVTIEDVLEQIVGDIEDEYDFDENEDNIIAEAGGRHRVKAQTEIADFNAHFGTDFADDEFDTVGGLVLQAFGRLPKRGEIGGHRRLPLPRRARRQPPPAHARRRARALAVGRGRAAVASRPGRPRRPRRRSRARAAGDAAGDAAAAAMMPAHVLQRVLAGLAGAATVFGFAPFGAPGVPVVTLALLFALWLRRDQRARRGGAGLRLRHRPVPRRRVVGLHRAQHLRRHARGAGGDRDGGFCAYLALFPALGRLCRARATRAGLVARALAAAALWTAAEWARGTGYTGFPWLSLGYAQLPPPAGTASPLAGFAPLGGVFLVTLAVALCAGALALAIDAITAGPAAAARSRSSPAWPMLGGGRRDARAASTGRRPPARRSRSRWCRATSRRTSSSSAGLRDETFALYVDLADASPAGASSCCPRARSRCSPTKCRSRCCWSSRARPPRATATSWPACSRRSAAARTRRAALLQQRAVARHQRRAALPQAPPRAVRRDRSRSSAIVGWFIRSVLAIPLADQTPGRRGPAAVRGRRRARGRQHLLRGRVRRRAAARRGRGDAARQRHQRRVVRPLARRRAAQPDRRDARARVRPPDAARDQHRHHVGDRPPRPRARAAALVHARHPRGRGRGPAGHDAVRALGRRAAARPPPPRCSLVAWLLGRGRADRAVRHCLSPGARGCR